MNQQQLQQFLSLDYLQALTIPTQCRWFGSLRQRDHQAHEERAATSGREEERDGDQRVLHPRPLPRRPGPSGRR